MRRRDGGAGAGAVVAGMRLRQLRVQLGDAALAPERQDFAQHEAERAGEEQRGEGEAEPAKAARLRPQTLDDAVDPEAERPARRGRRARVHSSVANVGRQRLRDAGGLRDLDLALAFVERLGRVGDRRGFGAHLGARRLGRGAVVEGDAGVVEPERARAWARFGHAFSLSGPRLLGSAAQFMPALRLEAKEHRRMKVEGACHCGRIAFEAEIDPARVSVCHCADCQTLTGSAFRVAAPTAEANFRLLSGEPKSYLKTTADSGRPRVQAFCADCGSPIYATSPSGENRILGCASAR